MFSRVTITLDIGPHSSFILLLSVCFRNKISMRFHTTIFCVFYCQNTCGLRFRNTSLWTMLAARHDCRSAIVLHDGGDVAEDRRSLAGVVEMCRPVNNPPRRNIVSVKNAAAVTPRHPKSRAILARVESRRQLVSLKWTSTKISCR